MIKNCFPNFELNYLPLDLHNRLLSKGIQTYHQFIDWVWHLPYHRTSDPDNLSLVILEEKGTCSSKHALLALVAHEHGYLSIQLQLGFFEINILNLHFIEAHCYLKYQDHLLDVTTSKPLIKLDIENPLYVATIFPWQAGFIKIIKHQIYLKEWCSKKGKNYETIWKKREHFIQRLSQ